MTFDFSILGAVEVHQDGEEVDLGSPRQRVLLVRLLLDAPNVISADRLIEDLWQQDQPHNARHALHVYISKIRKCLGSDRERLERLGHGYRLRLEPDELDVDRFERYLAEGRAARARGDPQTASGLLLEALDLWRGPALLDVRDEVFARDEITRLEALRLDAHEERLWVDLELAKHGEIVQELQVLVAKHPFREGLWEQLMLGLYRSGRQTDALRAFQSARDRLAEEFGVEPGPALRQMEGRILANDPALQLSADTEPARRILPHPRTSFVGRRRELADAAALLERSRLLTFTGAPGAGKSRLSLKVAQSVSDDFANGTFFVPLAAVDDPRLVGSEISRVLGMRHVKGESQWEAVEAYLAKRRVLLILDNFEQIVVTAPRVGKLLDAAPRLHILVTSRTPLGLSGEQEFLVPPLEVPPLDDLPGPEQLLRYDAVTLFATRAKAADPRFELDADNAHHVAEITVRLDGLPLAIELAAARTPLLSPHDLVKRLDRRLALLTGGPADSLDRHRTMRDAIGWSYDLLEESEQTIFQRLGVFKGGFTLDAATAVADDEEETVLGGLGSLLSKGLIHRRPDPGPARFALLEMMREYALDALAAAGDDYEVGQRHAEYFLRLAAEIEPDLTHEPQGSGVDRLLPEVDNVRRALGYALDSGDPDLGLALASHVWRFWQSTDQLTEGRDWLNKLLVHPDTSHESRADGLVALAGLAYWQGDYEETMERYREALGLFQAVGDRLNEADTLCSMSLTANWKEDLDAGEAYANAAGTVYEELGSREGIGQVLMAKAFVLWRRGEFSEAHDLWQESLAIARESGDQWLAVSQLVGLAGLTFHLGDRGRALSIVLDGVDEAVELHNTHLVVWLLDFVAAYAAPIAPEAAARLAGAVDELRKKAGGGILPGAIGIEDAKSVSGRLLGHDVVQGALAKGRRMGVDQAVALARSLHVANGPITHDGR